MEDKILKLLNSRHYTPANTSRIALQLSLPKGKQSALLGCLKRLERSGAIARIKGNRFIIPAEADLIPGRIQITRQGKGFLSPDDENLPEILIPSNATGTALHEDRVLVRRDTPASCERKAGEGLETGTVVRILERRRTQFIGTLQRGRQFLYVIPDDPRIHCDIYVPVPRDVSRPARTGDKVVVELLTWESKHANPEGEVVEVLGPPTKEGVDMLSILRQYDLPLRFPQSVLREARRLGNEVTATDREGRVDCRGHGVITIDPEDAKDFDDAFFLRRLGGSEWKLWVHIADVSHYVRPGSYLDKEAQKRGNSTYLVDRVIPMFPEALSNELCSLKPNVDRLTKCVEFVLRENGEVIRSRTYSATIHSKRRLAYEEALGILREKPIDRIGEMLHQANKLAQAIRKRRFRAGSLDLDFPENKIHLNDDGTVNRVELVENDISHQLIEEFMLLANEAIASRLMSRRSPTIYRIHEPPAERKLREYREEVLSHNIPCGNLQQPREVQKLLKRLATVPIGKALKIGFLRSLMRARYATSPIGHYGLAKAKYTHFTSPIRRYADLVAHRSLFEKHKPADLKKVADHISLTERNSADAERDSKEVKLFAYLSGQIKSGQLESYSALVTEVRNFGFFVDVESLGLGGLVPLSILEDDFYVFNTTTQEIRGRTNRRVIRIGDLVDIQVAKIDTFKKQIDFRLSPSKDRKQIRPKKKSRQSRRRR
ncbi:MAG: Ribonuclease R [Verrucomicrobia subdivision 3 bacterium]|nr:Ribonuclease R [Limisphaerales bacterium]MCS1415546.1 Ribonuclease R [Limisphaerales bacterium]